MSTPEGSAPAEYSVSGTRPEPDAGRPDPALTELASALWSLQQQSSLTLRALAKRTHVSSSAMWRYLNGRALPTAELVDRVAEQCGGDPAPLRELWLRATTARQARHRSTDSQATTLIPASPPAPVSEHGDVDPSRSTRRFRSAVPKLAAVVLLMTGTGVVVHEMTLRSIPEPAGALPIVRPSAKESSGVVTTPPMSVPSASVTPARTPDNSKPGTSPTSTPSAPGPAKLPPQASQSTKPAPDVPVASPVKREPEVKEVCSAQTNVPLFRQSGSNPSFPNSYAKACFTTTDGVAGEATLIFSTHRAELRHVQVTWRVEAHDCADGALVAGRDYAEKVYDGVVFTGRTNASFARSESKTYRTEGHIKSLRIEDANGNVFAANDVTAVSPCA